MWQLSAMGAMSKASKFV